MDKKCKILGMWTIGKFLIDGYMKVIQIIPLCFP